jgi:nucleotide-binding universal stress UspA family protein
MKDLFAVVTPVLASGDTPPHSASYALALAALSGAHLSALVSEVDAASPIEYDNIRGGNVITKSGFMTERLTRTRELIQAAAKLTNLTCSFLAAEDRSRSLRDVLVDNAQVRDLVIFDVEGPLRHPRQGLVEALLFGSGRPLILVPRAARPVAEGVALVAWDATRSAVRALHDALPLLIRAQEVAIVSVTDDKEIPAARSGEDICRYLGRWGINSRFDPVKRGSQKVGDALLDCAAQMKADLLVMGGFGHAREREFLFGSATRDVFQSNLEVAVLLSH